MPSQEEYLDQLLRNIMNGGKEPPQTEPAEEEVNTVQTVEELPEEPADIPEIFGMPESIMEQTGLLGTMENVGEMPGGEINFSETLGNVPEQEEFSGIMDNMTEIADDVSGIPEMPVDTLEHMEPFGSMEDSTAFSGDISGGADISGMVEVPQDILELAGFSDEIPAAVGTNDDMSVEPDILAAVGINDDMSVEPDIPAAVGTNDDMSVEPDILAALEHFDNVSEEPDIAVAAETIGDMSMEQDAIDMAGASEVSETGEMPETLQTAEMRSTPESMEETDIAELLKSFEDTMNMSAENGEEAEKSAEIPASDFSDIISGEEEDFPEATDISAMSEEDIERLLAESRSLADSSAGSSGEELQGDVVDLLEGTDDSELQEIQDLLEKSDNNEAVGDEIEALLKGAVQDNYQNTSGNRAGVGADSIDLTEEQLSPKQKKAMEKKRIKEEKAAARKADKEAKKAEKAARKAARKAGKENGGVQDTENALSAESSGGTATGTEENVDTAFLDSILSEAGKIDDAEAVSSATGNYEAKVDGLIPDEGEDMSDSRKDKSASSANVGLEIDMDNLFGGSAEAESALMAGGGDDFPDFVALDGDDVTGIMELAGGEEEESKPRKKGFFSRFLEFLTEEDEEEEENENIRLSEENQEIIDDLDKEKKKEGKKGKKSKKKAKTVEASAEDGEDGGEGEENKKGKKKKAKKPKKEKIPKEEEPVDPRNRLSLKKVMPVALICLSLGAAIIIITYASVNFTGRKAARDAYYAGDYQTCYQNLYGKDLNETEQIMYGKAQSILTIRLWIREYEMLTAEGARLEALDSLIQSVNDYPVLYEYAGQWNAAGEVAQEYATILNLLFENYGLTEDQARAIAAETDDIEYTRQVNAIVQGGAYGSWNEPEPVVDVPLQDELPEETELPEGNFIDTNTSVQ